VLCGGQALALPYAPLFGSLSTESKDYQKEIDEFLNYLLEKDFPFLNKEKLTELRALKLGTKSNIPVGYGLGSSGVITAAVYDICLDNSVKDLNELQIRLGLMESFFHGKSSGFDPLVSYTNQALLKKDDQLHIIDQASLSLPNEKGLLLLNTGIARSTGPLVNQVKELCEDSDYDQIFKSEYLFAQDAAINVLINNKAQELDVNILAISKFQYKDLSFLIPDELKSFWKIGLTNEAYTCKLCGAGGGGFILVFYDKEGFGGVPSGYESIAIII